MKQNTIINYVRSSLVAMATESFFFALSLEVQCDDQSAIATDSYTNVHLDIISNKMPFKKENIFFVRTLLLIVNGLTKPLKRVQFEKCCKGI